MNWRTEAACSEYPLDWFFPGVGGDYRQGKAVCAGCPVRAECLEEALTSMEAKADHGLWGGTTPSERRGMRQGRAYEARCQVCEQLFVYVLNITRPVYCSDACSQSAYRERKRREYHLRHGMWVAS